MNLIRAWPLILVVALGCPGDSQPGNASQAPVVPDADPFADEGPTRECFVCVGEFSGPGESSPLAGLPVCTPECAADLKQKVDEAKVDGERVCFECGELVAQNDASYWGPRSFCNDDCREAFQEAAPKPTCRSCSAEVEGPGTNFEVSREWAERANLRFCDQACADSWVEGMNEQQGTR